MGKGPIGRIASRVMMGVQDIQRLLSGGPHVPAAAPTPVDPFVQHFLLNKQQGEADPIYANYLKSIQLPPSAAPTPAQPMGMIQRLMGGAEAGIRRAVPYMDTAQGHQDLTSTLQSYPFTPGARQVLSPGTVIRDSMSKRVVEEEAETNPEKVLGLIPTGRDRMDIASKLELSPRPSVVEHELMHSYLDHKGWPYDRNAFNKDWEAAKAKTPLLQTIDSWVATSPDYADEMDPESISQERYAYLAQALAGGGLQAFPAGLRRHYAPVFTDKVKANGKGNQDR